ncbi:MAG: DNA repair protein RecO [Planctomycetaceae bacterium]|nr:DNA repair protein RecO [Planctomycetaceae bacterium]
MLLPATGYCSCGLAVTILGMRHRELAICLRAYDYSETSQVLHFLTRSGGAVRALGKGTKRPKSKSGGLVDMFSEGELIYSTGRGESLATLIEYTESDSHSALRKDLRRLNAGLYMIEIVAATVSEADVHVEVFDLLHNALARLGQADAPVQAVLAFFQWRLLGHLGLLGDLRLCQGCQTPLIAAAPAPKGRQEVFFSSTMGGLICTRCRMTAKEAIAVDAPALAGIAALTASRSTKRPALEEPQARKVNRLLCYHIAQQINHWPKMARHVVGRVAGSQ